MIRMCILAMAVTIIVLLRMVWFVQEAMLRGMIHVLRTEAMEEILESCHVMMEILEMAMGDHLLVRSRQAFIV